MTLTLVVTDCYGVKALNLWKTGQVYADAKGLPNTVHHKCPWARPSAISVRTTKLDMAFVNIIAWDDIDVMSILIKIMIWPREGTK